MSRHIDDGIKCCAHVERHAFGRTEQHQSIRVTQYRVAIRRCSGNQFGTDDAGTAGSVIHHRGLAQTLVQYLPCGARNRVSASPRRYRNDNADGTKRIARRSRRSFLRQRCAARHQHNSGCSENHPAEHFSDCSLHINSLSVPPPA